MNDETKLVKGFGINDADYTVRVKEAYYLDGKRKMKTLWECPFYTKWLSMITRTNCNNYKNNKPTYKDKSVCEDWKYFSNFKKWMEQQNWENMELDKDILVEGNSVYSPETCVFVPRYINMIITLGSSKTSHLPLGVSLRRADPRMVNPHKKPFVSRVNIDGVTKVLGFFKTEEEAHCSWQIGKALAIESAIDTYSKSKAFNSRVADSLMRRIWRLRLDNSTKTETKFL